MEKDQTLKGEKIFSFGLCFHKTGGIMSVDLRHRYHKDDKISMLDQDRRNLPINITVDYITENNYYEIKVGGMGI